MSTSIFCDFCGKEIPRDWAKPTTGRVLLVAQKGEFRGKSIGLYIGTELDKVDMCRDCQKDLAVSIVPTEQGWKGQD
jgi:hypothetical protein